MGENTTVQSKVEVKNDEQRVKNFVAAYEKICEEHQLRIVTTPAWRVSQDTGDLVGKTLTFKNGIITGYA